MPATNPATSLSTVPLDAQMVPGMTYTFQFKCANIICLTDISSTFQSDIVTYGPAYVASLQVSSPFTTNLYNVQFTYTADGSDVVSDVANELIVAAQQGSGDSFVFVGAVEASAAEATVGISQAVGFTAQTAGSAVGSVAGSAASAATSSTSFTVILIVIVLAVLGYFLTVSGAGAALRHSEGA